ncbi:MAG TPA: hypothetical protein VMZ22_09145 [Acidimicrobiales bacterium]|nr:hypothetical protein [Acidimicrobiales bacterium]
MGTRRLGKRFVDVDRYLLTDGPMALRLPAVRTPTRVAASATRARLSLRRSLHTALNPWPRNVAVKRSA